MHIWGPPTLQTPPKFHEKTPREGRKERIFRREREKKSEILGGPGEGGPGKGGPGEGWSWVSLGEGVFGGSPVGLRWVSGGSPGALRWVSGGSLFFPPFKPPSPFKTPLPFIFTEKRKNKKEKKTFGFKGGFQGGFKGRFKPNPLWFEGVKPVWTKGWFGSSAYLKGGLKGGLKGEGGLNQTPFWFKPLSNPFGEALPPAGMHFGHLSEEMIRLRPTLAKPTLALAKSDFGQTDFGQKNLTDFGQP